MKWLKFPHDFFYSRYVSVDRRFEIICVSRAPFQLADWQLLHRSVAVRQRDEWTSHSYRRHRQLAFTNTMRDAMRACDELLNDGIITERRGACCEPSIEHGELYERWQRRSHSQKGARNGSQD
jgi:hypothetical protein